ncbi:MAG TPA: hypothetical protein VM369_05110, partial [Candidatus Binatia bacterium]|nr:hypothetical protein [Candidatus Binatia bacterium]
MRLATLLTCLLLLASAAHGAADPARALGQQRMLAYVRDGTLRTDYAARAARRLAAAEGPPAAERLARELRTAGLRVRDRAEGEPLVADWTGRSRATEIVLLRACLPVAHEGDAEAAAIAGVMQAYASLRLRPQRTVRVAFVPAT